MSTELVTEPVVFLTNARPNVVIIVERQTKMIRRSAEGVPILELAAPDHKAKFNGGICKTDDPVVIAYLDGRDDCWRGDDPLASLKMQYGSDEVGAIAEAVASQIEPEYESDEEDER